MEEVFVVDREWWLHPEAREAAGVDSCLLEEGTGLMCCLGQYARHKGIPDVALSGVASPMLLSHDHQSVFPSELLVEPTPGTLFRVWDSALSRDIQRTNDGRSRSTMADRLSLSEREAHLTELFAKVGIRLEFKGDAALAVQRAVDYSAKKNDTQKVA